MSGRQWRRIKYAAKDGKVTLEWSESKLGDKTTIEQRLVSTERPAPGFPKALDAFKRYALDLLELPAMYGAGLAVSGVSITTQEDGRVGFVATCTKALAGSDAPAVFNTPYLAEPGDGGGAALGSRDLQLLHGLEAAADRFLEGDREQAELFETPGTDASQATLSAAGKSVTMSGEQFSQLADGAIAGVIPRSRAKR